MKTVDRKNSVAFKHDYTGPHSKTSQSLSTTPNSNEGGIETSSGILRFDLDNQQSKLSVLSTPKLTSEEPEQGQESETMTTYLCFHQADLESEFAAYFYSMNNLRWKRTLFLSFGLLTFMYIYLIIRNTLESVEWVTKYHPSLRSGTLVCPSGWYCNTCNPDIICNNYDPVLDTTFWFGSVLIPYTVALAFYYNAMSQNFADYIDRVTVSLMLCHVLIGVGIRYYVMEASNNFLQPSIIMILMMIIYTNGARMRFLHATCSVCFITFVWVLINIVGWAVSNNGYRGSAYIIGFICIIGVSTIIAFASYETEHFHRIQFLMSKEMKKNNAKLKNQLNLLAKSYNQQAVKSLDSPLERSMMVIRSVMADPSLYSRHLLALGQVTALLASSNLLTPDLESNLADSMDNEQQAWLFSEIAARKRKGRGKVNPRRRSLMAEVAQKVGHTTIKEVERESDPVDSENNSTRRLSDHKITSKMSAVDIRAMYPPQLEEIQQLLQTYNNFNFNIFELQKLTENRALTILSHHLFAEANLFDLFVIPIDKFSNYIRAIEKGYHADLPCKEWLKLDHNSLHATDVLHCMHTLAHTTKIKEIWTDIELLGMYFAAIIHDHDHPGLTNNFLVTTSDPKAILYNDKAVLENHHSASSFLVLAQPENNFLSHLSKSDFKSIREIVVDLVLATDLTQHFTLLSMFKSKAASSETFDPYEIREDRMLLFKIMIKCSDVSNPTKELSIYKPWCRMIMSEFMMQGDMEKKLNIPVSPYMDRDNSNVPSCQIGFIDFVVQPLFGALDTYQNIPQILARLAKNREYWSNLKLQGITSIPEDKPDPNHKNDLSTNDSNKHIVVDIAGS